MRKLGAAALLALSCGVMTGCGGGDDGAGSGGDAKRGGSITIAQTSQPDYLDPALSYTVNGWEPMWLVYTPPLTYRRAEGKEGTELIPGTADALPEVSEDGRTYTFRIREGIKYSNGRPVRASDFEHTIKRVLNMESGGAAFYEGIVGAKEYEEAGKPEGDISGIEADDATGEVTVKLEEADGTFNNVLAMNFAGMVPSNTPFKNLSKDPPPGYGPYAITKSVPNREFVMEQVQGFDAPDIPKGNLQRITTRIVKSAERQAQDVIDGKLDYMQDPPPADLLPEVRSKYKDRYEEFATVSTYYFFMNGRTKPFDKKEVREAVNVALDSKALARLFGGRLEPSCNFLPRDMVGFEKVEPCPFGDPNGPGDPEKARKMIEDAGADGEAVTVYTNNDENRPEIGQYYTDLLNKIGLKAKLKTVDGGVYFQTIGNQKTRAQTGFANWFQDFPHPANFMFLVDGSTIQPTNNQNFSNVDDPEINREIAELKTETDLQSVADRWAAIDRKLIEESYVAPYGSEKLSTFLSERMDFENCSLFHPLYYNDYSSFCLK
jgi:peptide/nickel transport system substrate-binding protein